jgi:hypothetical protein
MYTAGKLASPRNFHKQPAVIHRLSTGQGVGVGSARKEQAPPVVEYGGGVYSVPQQKIFAKVKAHYASDLRLYIL